MKKEEDQARFLEAYAREGSLLAARRVTGITRWSYRQWVIDEPGESLEGLALERVRNPDKNRGSDVLLMGLLNANLPHKYRPAQAMDTDAAKELIVEWRKAAQQAKASMKAQGANEEPLSAPIERTLIEILANRKSDEPNEDELSS